MGKRFWQIFFFGELAGALTALTFYMDSSANAYHDGFNLLGRFDGNWLCMILYLINIIIIGMIVAAFFSLCGYFCLWDKNLIIIIPLLYISGVAVTIFISMISYRFYGPNHVTIPGLLGIHVFWILALLLAKFFAPKLKKMEL